MECFGEKVKKIVLTALFSSAWTGYRGSRPDRLEPNLDFDERRWFLSLVEPTKRGSRGAARAAKSLRWRV